MQIVSCALLCMYIARARVLQFTCQNVNLSPTFIFIYFGLFHLFALFGVKLQPHQSKPAW